MGLRMGIKGWEGLQRKGCNGMGATEGVQQGQEAAFDHILANQDTHCPGGEYMDTKYYGSWQVCGQVRA